MIKEFRGEYRFLSNFWPATVVLNEVEYPTVEHAYQAAKCRHRSDRSYICAAETAGEAKKRGREIEIRHDCSQVEKVNLATEI